MGDLIDRDELVTKGAVFDALKDNTFRLTLAEEQRCEGHVVWDEDVVFADVFEKVLLALPSAQPEIIRCNVCRHWHQTTGEMKGFGLGDCDYLEKKLVTCNGYCYWAERKEDE